jgi:ribosomal protein S18 acetylase RimI-like enzyme
VRYRIAPAHSDVLAVRALAAKVGVFSDAEQAVAVELVEDGLRLGRASGYWFVFAEQDGAPVGYSAWGPIPMTAESFDLYWIAVDPDCQGAGVGRGLLDVTERKVYEHGGRRLYIETSSRSQYARTRRFYRRAGYRQVARLEDFYAPDDHKIVYCKVLDSIAER